MKKSARLFCLFFLPVALLPLLICCAIFLLPAQYDATFLGALRDKEALLKSPGDKPRIIVVGGSSVAFGQKSDLLAAEFPEYDTVNFGLYAGLGTAAMMDLSAPLVRPGDIVILSPEQNAQTLSGYFGAKAMWQAADGQFELLKSIASSRRPALLGEAMAFSAEKFNLWRTGTKPEGDGVYRRNGFNPWGDLAAEGREGNAMPGGFDPDMPIRFDPALLDKDFLREMNAYAAACRKGGAKVYYRFCPMNAAAIAPEERARAQAYTGLLEEALDFPLLGTAEESMLDAAWFFDTNFHLNDRGAVLNTREMARQLKKVLGRTGEVGIPVPEAPAALSYAGENGGDGEETACFVWEERDGAAHLTGLTALGRERERISVPAAAAGLPVVSFSPSVFSGNERVREITLPDTIRRIENDSFSGCDALERLVLRQESPSRLSVGDGLLNGTACTVFVPANAYSRYQTSYFWSIHASRIKPDADTPPAGEEASPAVPAGMDVMYADANGGRALHGQETRVAFPVSAAHLRTNTPLGQKLFCREGYAPLCWNTRADGTGEDIPFGSRTDSRSGETLYMRWLPCPAEEAFQWEARDGKACVTGWTGKSADLVIPRTLGGLEVARIATGAFSGVQAERAVLPDTVFAVERGAFSGCGMREIWLYDSLFYVYDDSFSGCEALQTLYVGAAGSPRYSGSYFAAFADKMDWLRQVRGEKKLVLSGGSATRYAYDSVRLKSAFPAYQPVNMGVYAYTNALPQLRMIARYMGPGDVILSAPEFDTPGTQFCVSDALDDRFWAMMEADYANAALLDLKQYTKVFSSLCAYLQNRSMMAAGSWEDSPSHYDDDGHPVPYSTYNLYGDYVLIRPNGDRDELLQSYRADYTVASFPEEMVEALNRVYREFQEKGVLVLFTYAPRNHSALTEESTPEARRALHAYLRAALCVPVIQDIEEGLFPGTACYLIDNHLSDEGVRTHMENVLRALKEMGLE